ncbi:MAG TPA: hypothetical protein VMH87_12280 [Pseudomonadales bacterium]|nr:hypothetical protein [Pseudomonadales bacterium]
MFGQQITELELRKKLLLLESSQNRLQLRMELQELRSRLGPLESLANAGSKLGPWTLGLGAAAGLMGAMGLRGSLRGTGMIGKALALAPVAIKLWRAFKSRNAPPE